MTAQQIDVHGLPELPAGLNGWLSEHQRGIVRELMQDHARAAVEAALRQSGEAVAWVSHDTSIAVVSAELPPGTKLYTYPPATSGLVEAQQELVTACKQRDALDVECARLEQVADGLVEALHAARDWIAALDVPHSVTSAILNGIDDELAAHDARGG